jgi:hypothetical protein
VAVIRVDVVAVVADLAVVDDAIAAEGAAGHSAVTARSAGPVA